MILILSAALTGCLLLLDLGRNVLKLPMLRDTPSSSVLRKWCAQQRNNQQYCVALPSVESNGGFKSSGRKISRRSITPMLSSEGTPLEMSNALMMIHIKALHSFTVTRCAHQSHI